MSGVIPPSSALLVFAREDALYRSLCGLLDEESRLGQALPFEDFAGYLLGTFGSGATAL